MNIEYYKVLNSYNEKQGAVLFDDSVPFAKRIEIKELIRQSEFKLESIIKEEYDTTVKKFEI